MSLSTQYQYIQTDTEHDALNLAQKLHDEICFATNWSITKKLIHLGFTVVSGFPVFKFCGLSVRQD